MTSVESGRPPVPLPGATPLDKSERSLGPWPYPAVSTRTGRTAYMSKGHFRPYPPCGGVPRRARPKTVAKRLERRFADDPEDAEGTCVTRLVRPGRRDR